MGGEMSHSSKKEYTEYIVVERGISIFISTSKDKIISILYSKWQMLDFTTMSNNVLERVHVCISHSEYSNTEGFYFLFKDLIKYLTNY